MPSLPIEVRIIILYIVISVPVKFMLYFKVMCQILGLFGIEDLLSLRHISREWNEFVLHVLQVHSHPPIELVNNDAGAQVNRFLETMKSKIQGAFTFSAFQLSIYKEGSRIQHFFDEIGQHLTSLTLDVSSNESMSYIHEVIGTGCAPRLEKLVLCGEFLTTAFLSVPIYKLSRLHSLVISPLPSAAEKTGGSLELSELVNWIGSSAGIQFLECGFVVVVKSQQLLLEFIHTRPKFRRLTLKVYLVKGSEIPTEYIPKVSSTPLGILNLDLSYNDENDGGLLISNCLLHFSPALRTVSMKSFDALLLRDASVLSNLKGIRIWLCRGMESSFLSFIGRIQEKNVLACLHTVTLEMFGQLDFTGSVLGSMAFWSVENVRLIRGFTLTGRPYFPWHEIFPRMKSFQIQGIVICYHLDYINTYLTQITHLCIVASLGSTLDSSLIHRKETEIEGTPVNWKRNHSEKNLFWPLDGLKGIIQYISSL